MNRKPKRIKVGWAFHLHHETLVEWCTDYDDRVRFIKDDKPKDEQSLRLRLFKIIPVKQLPREWQKAYAERQKAYAEWRKAYAEISPFFEILHKKLCKKCPWNGQTIFTRQNKDEVWY